MYGYQPLKVKGQRPVWGYCQVVEHCLPNNHMPVDFIKAVRRNEGKEEEERRKEGGRKGRKKEKRGKRYRRRAIALGINTGV